MTLLDATDLLDLQHSLELYAKITELPTFAIDTKGNVIAKSGELPGFCTLFEELTAEACPCRQAHLYAGREADIIGDAYVYFCPAGLVHWTAPLIVKDGLAGALISGEVNMNVFDPFMIDTVLNAYKLPIACKGKLSAYMKSIPVIEPEKVRYLSEMLNLVAKAFGNNAGQRLNERRQFYREQRLIGESIHELKDREPESELSDKYPLTAEKELVNKVKLGDKAGARAMLNEILGYIFFQYGGNLEMMTVRGLELLVIISRAAIEGGGDAASIYELSRQYLLDIPKIESVEQLSFLIVKILDAFSDLVFPVIGAENASAVKSAIKYIHENYMHALNLSEVSARVALSPAYFSRLFKRKTGMNFSDYLNHVRIEESKKFLIDSQHPLSEIALMVGFSDQSYYTKVFKKFTKVSPGGFKKNLQ